MSAAPRALAGALLALTAAAAGTTAAAAPPCLVDLRLDPERALVGEQVLYAVRILRRTDVAHVSWLEPLAFPGFRAEWLPARVSKTPEHRHGERYLVVEERRALFPVRAGDLVIPPAKLHCAVAGRDDASGIVPVPGTRLAVGRPPEAGRPEGWSGLVGRVDVRALADPERIALGGSVRVSLTVQGDANVWSIEDPLPGLAGLARAEVFARRPELHVQAGRRLGTRRSFVFDVVPREPGVLRLPGARIPYFDPERGAYGVARTDPLRIWIDAPPEPTLEDAALPGAARNPRTAAQDGPSPAAAREGPAPALRVIGTGAGLVALAGVLLLARARRRRAARFGGVDAALRTAASALGRGDAALELRALEAALREALAIRLGVPDAADPEALRERAAGDPQTASALALLDEIERTRFARDAAPLPARRVHAAVRELRRGRGG